MRSLEDLTVPELLATARAATEKSQLFDTILSDPATRKEALALVKKRNPNMPIPELDAENAASAAVAEERKEREKLEARMRESEMRERIAAQRTTVRDKYKLTDADLLEVEKIMTDETAPIPHYDAAVKVWRAQKSQAVPTSSNISPPVYEMPTKDVWKSGIGNNANLNKVAMKLGYDAWNEIRAGKVAGQ
jgi:hypothetical protein